MQHWLQELNRQIFPVPRQRLHQAPICARIFVQLFRRNIDIFAETGGGAVIQRMRQWNFGLDPFKTEALQRQRFEKRRACCKWMNCRTDVMQKARQSEFGRTRAAADCRVCFVNKNGTSRARQCDRRRETIRSRANDNRITSIWHEFPVATILEAALASCDLKATPGRVSRANAQNLSIQLLWSEHSLTKLKPTFRSRSTARRLRKRRSARNNCSRNTRRYSGFIWRVRPF